MLNVIPSSFEHKAIFQKWNVKAEMNFIENLPFSLLESVFPIKALPYSFFPQKRCLSDKKMGKYMWVSKTLLLLT